MGFFSKLKEQISHAQAGGSSSSSHGHPELPSGAPPAWAPAPEVSHQYGKWNEAPEDEYQAAEDFCVQYPPNPPRLLPSAAVDYINATGAKAWGLEQPVTPRFLGVITNPSNNFNPDSKSSHNAAPVVRVSTASGTKDTCLLSTLPLLAGLYDVHGKQGIYYEVKVLKMRGFIALGTACRPYPVWRMPGWNRLSAGWHLDDLRKFFEDPDGGRDYVDSSLVSQIRDGDTIGCGYELATGGLFFTYNGMRLPNAFTGIYLPRHEFDVFAAIGVEGESEFEVNFGADVFRWKEANEWAWRMEGHVGKIVGTSREYDNELPAYAA